MTTSTEAEHTRSGRDINPWITQGPEDREPEHLPTRRVVAPQAEELPADEPERHVPRNLASMLHLGITRGRKPQPAPQPGAVTGRRSHRTGHDDAHRTRSAAKRTQDVLGYRAMLPSGIAWLGEDEWSATLTISDINYLAAEQNSQEAIVDRWARFLNSFGAGTRIEISVVDRVLDDDDVADLIAKRPTGDRYDGLRADWNRIVRQKLAATTGNTVTEKYLTLTVQEPDREKAEASLVRMTHEAATQLSAMEGCTARMLNRAERLEVFSHMLRPHELFTFTEDEFTADKKLATADFAAPWAIETTTGAGPLVFHNGSGETYHTVLWLRTYPAWLSDRLVSDLADIKCDLTVSLHLEPYDQGDGMTVVQRQIAELEMQTISEQKKAAKQGYSEDLIPHRLVEAASEAKELRAELEQSNQKIFSSVLVIGVSGSTRAQLDQNVARAQRVIRRQSCGAEITSFMQLDALSTELPIGVRRIPMRRTLTTSSAAIIVPFTTQELFAPGGNWYGVNATSGNAVVADRAATLNGNGFILGTTGSGKSQAAKMEMTQIFLSRPDDDIIIIDPEREYEPLVRELAGQIVQVDTSGAQRLNAMDISLDVETNDQDPITEKAHFVLSMVGVLIGGAEGLTATQRSLIDRCAVSVYRTFAADGGEMPTLEDLRRALLATNTPDGVDLATALEIYTTGSLGAFSHHTTINLDNRLISWDISGLGAELRTFGMLVILDQVWARVVRNRMVGRRTWLYIDELHILFSNRYAIEYLRTLWKRGRKWGLIPTGITQNIDELLVNDDARLMLANSDFLLLMSQTATDADSLCALLHLSEEQRRHFTHVPQGNGLLRSGNAVIPVDGQIPTTSQLYRLCTTKFGEA